MLPRQPYTRYGACHVVDLLVTRMPGVIVTNMESVGNE
jgi:hypothetical protein